MNLKQKIKASKYLSLLLRHSPESGNITLDASGWADVQSVLRAMKEQMVGITPTILYEIVAEDAKQRYSISDCSRYIRANQGHSIPVDLGLTAIEPPVVLFHGTARKTLWMIQRDGLLPMDRQYVHLSGDQNTAISVGKRHGEPVVLLIQAHDLHRNGHEFYQSENGVWLTPSVPPEFLSVHDEMAVSES